MTWTSLDKLFLAKHQFDDKTHRIPNSQYQTPLMETICNSMGCLIDNSKSNYQNIQGENVDSWYQNTTIKRLEKLKETGWNKINSKHNQNPKSLIYQTNCHSRLTSLAHNRTNYCLFLLPRIFELSSVSNPKAKTQSPCINSRLWQWV